MKIYFPDKKTKIDVINIVTVSYTHLDVYKRQALHGATVRDQKYTQVK